jgi:hypothetical protein
LSIIRFAAGLWQTSATLNYRRRSADVDQIVGDYAKPTQRLIPASPLQGDLLIKSHV